MLILAIDSTSYLPRIALVQDLTPLRELNQTKNKIIWDDFRSGDGSYLGKEYNFQLEQLWKYTSYTIQDLDLICYSGMSGFEKAMRQGLIFSRSLGEKYTIPVQAVDHITSHDISTFIGQTGAGTSMPILIFSASGSHNSFSLIESLKSLKKLGDSTEFDKYEKRYVGLGNIFFRLIKSLALFESPSGSNNISEIISKLDYKVSPKLLSFILMKYKGDSIYELNLLKVFNLYFEKFINKKKYSTEELYFSFEQAIIQICLYKFLKIYEEKQFQELHIVGGISQNEYFYKSIQEEFSKKGVKVYRPLEEYRFDNASMLGILAYLEYNGGKYEVSNIVTQ